MASEEPGFKNFADVLKTLGTHPSAMILGALENGALRLSELSADRSDVDEESLGIALRELDAAGLVARRVDPGPPLRVLYVLTERGTQIAPALGRLVKWVAENP